MQACQRKPRKKLFASEEKSFIGSATGYLGFSVRQKMRTSQINRLENEFF